MGHINRVLVFTVFILPAATILFGSKYPIQDSVKLHHINVKTPKELHSLFHYTGEPLPVVSAHRGGSLDNYPENCIETFENTLKYTYAIIECDPRYSKDSAIVLHHDPTLERTTNGKGVVVNYTLRELKRLKLKDPSGTITDYRIPTLDEALEWAKGNTILVLDQKDVPVIARVKKVEEHNAEANVILIVYSFEDARICYNLNNNIMMEVMIPDIEKAAEFEKSGIPWENVVAFVGHNVPADKELYELIHQKGALCLAGSSRSIDRKYLNGSVKEFESLKNDYMEFLNKGIDVIETDLPILLGPVLNKKMPSNSTKTKYLNERGY
jgi:glycerophosphoryl diester phosphodiesterase